MCIVTREVKDEEHSSASFAAPMAKRFPTCSGKLPGRGVWVSLSRGRWQRRSGKHLFSRGFRAETQASDDLAGHGRGSSAQAGPFLSPLAKKAGQAVCRLHEGGGMLRPRQARVLIYMRRKPAPDGRRKLDQLAAARRRNDQYFTGDELDLAFGRSNVVHAAVARGGLPKNSSRPCGGLRHMSPVEAFETVERA